MDPFLPYMIQAVSFEVRKPRVFHTKLYRYFQSTLYRLQLIQTLSIDTEIPPETHIVVLCHMTIII